MDMLYIKKLEILLVYCFSTIEGKSKIIKLNCAKNHQSSLILGSFRGSNIPNKTFSASYDENNIYLNCENNSIRVLSQYANGNFTIDVTIPVPYQLQQILPYGNNRVVILDRESKISILDLNLREGNFKFLLKRGIIYSKTEQLQNETLQTIRFCPKEEYICATSKKPSQGKNKFGFSKLYILRIKTKENGVFALEKLFQMAFSYNFPKSAEVLIPFYYKGKPILAILEEKVGSRVYF